MYNQTMKEKIPNQYPVTSNPQILGGTPVIIGTRIPATLVRDLLKRGYPTSVIVQEYPSLTLEKIGAFLSLIGKDSNDQTLSQI